MKEIKVKLNLKKLDRIFEKHMNDDYKDLKEMYDSSPYKQYTKYVILGWMAHNDGRKDIKDRIYGEILDNVNMDKKTAKHLMEYLKNGSYSVSVMKKFDSLLDKPEQFKVIQV